MAAVGKAPPRSAYLTWTGGDGTPQQMVFDLVESEDWDLDAAVTEHPVERGADVADNVRVKLAKCMLRVFVTNEPIDSNQWSNAIPGVQFISLPSPTWVPGSGIVDVLEYRNFIAERALLGTGAGVLGNALGGQVGGAIGAIGGGLLAGALLPGVTVHVPTATDAGLTPPTPPPGLSPTVLGFDTPDDFVARTFQQLELLKDEGEPIDVVGTKRVFAHMVIEALKLHRGQDTGSGAEMLIGLKEVRIVSTVNVPAPAASVPRAKPPVQKGEQNTTPAPAAQEGVAHRFLGMR